MTYERAAFTTWETPSGVRHDGARSIGRNVTVHPAMSTDSPADSFPVDATKRPSPSPDDSSRSEETSPADPQLIASALNNLAYSLIELGGDGEAEPLLIRATELRASYPNPHYWLAQIYRRRGEGDNRRREVQAWRRYLEIGATSDEREREAEVRLAELEA